MIAQLEATSRRGIRARLALAAVICSLALAAEACSSAEAVTPPADPGQRDQAGDVNADSFTNPDSYTNPGSSPRTAPGSRGRPGSGSSPASATQRRPLCRCDGGWSICGMC